MTITIETGAFTITVQCKGEVLTILEELTPEQQLIILEDIKQDFTRDARNTQQFFTRTHVEDVLNQERILREETGSQDMLDQLLRIRRNKECVPAPIPCDEASD